MTLIMIAGKIILKSSNAGKCSMYEVMNGVIFIMITEQYKFIFSMFCVAGISSLITYYLIDMDT
jgi:hypothetical protein